jgi:hypothetical protein
MDSHDDIARLFRQIGHRPDDYREFGGAALPTPEDAESPLLLLVPPDETTVPMPVATMPMAPE